MDGVYSFRPQVGQDLIYYYHKGLKPYLETTVLLVDEFKLWNQDIVYNLLN